LLSLHNYLEEWGFPANFTPFIAVIAKHEKDIHHRYRVYFTRFAVDAVLLKKDLPSL